MRGLLGFRAQNMGGLRLSIPPTPAGMIDTRSGSYVTTADYVADIFAWGGGGTGNSNAVYNSAGGGAAGYSRLLLPRGSNIVWTGGQPRVGAAPGTSSGSFGVDATVTVNGVLMTAQGGRFGSSSTIAARSVATGFQINRYGGGSGEAGEFGGAPGSNGGGGGAGGFRDIFPGLTGGDGAPTSSSSGAQTVPDYGGGGGAQTDGTQYSTWGGASRVLILLYRI